MGLARALAVATDTYGETVPVDDFVTWSEWALAWAPLPKLPDHIKEVLK